MSEEDIRSGQVFLIDKPLEWTSFDVVNKMRYALRRHYGIKKIKVGHAGTLDPLATGLLIICVGKMTKQIERFMGLPKVYTGSLALGSTTPSYDRETSPDKHFPFEHISPEDVQRAASHFTGSLEQRPPIFSAIKKDGQKAYQSARSGREIQMEKRPVVIHSLELEGPQDGELHFRVHCSKGTYIRSLAHDLGHFLNSGAHLASLRRTHIGPFAVQDALTVNEWLDRLQGDNLPIERIPEHLS